MKHGSIESPRLKKVLLVTSRNANSLLTEELLENETELTRDRIQMALRSLRTKGVLSYTILPEGNIVAQVTNSDIFTHLEATRCMSRDDVNHIGYCRRCDRCTVLDKDCWIEDTPNGNECIYWQQPWNYSVK